MRFLSAGESHGEGIIALLEGFPKGVRIEESFINQELRRRQSGVGRGERMHIEEDRVEFLSGLRNKITLGSPIAMLVRNREVKIFAQKEDNLEPLVFPRAAHADLAGCLKYGEKDIRNILERASARETVARVCVGAICKQFLLHFNIRIASFTYSVGEITISKEPRGISEIFKKTKGSLLNCVDREREVLMLKAIEKAQKEKDTLGGIVELWVEGLCPGLGSFMHFDRRLDARLSQYLISIPAVKAIEFGLGFDYARKRGSLSHDAIYYHPQKGFYRKTNNAGGIEGGVSNGMPIVMRIAAKPIATLTKPLDSVNLITKKKGLAIYQRSDVCAIVALGVIAESMSAIALVEAFLEKFGSDSLKEISFSYKNYLKGLKKF